MTVLRGLTRGAAQAVAPRVGRSGSVVLLMLCFALALAPRIYGASFTATVTVSADDAKTYGTNMETDAVNALIGSTGSYVCDYLVRFPGVAVPSEVSIDSVFLTLRCMATGSADVCRATIWAEDTASAAPFSTWTDYTARRLAGGSVLWDSIQSMEVGVWYRTPDLSSCFGEVIARSDWSSGNALAVFIRDDNSTPGASRRLYQYDGSASSACSLVVYYTETFPEHDNVRRRRSTACSIFERGECHAEEACLPVRPHSKRGSDR